MRRSARLLAGALLLASCAPRRIVHHGAIDEDALGDVRRALPVMRGLGFTAPVPAQALDQASLRTMLLADIDRSYGPGDLETMARVYARLGLVPPGTNLRTAIERLYEQEGAGFYDPRSKRLMVSTHAVDEVGWGMKVLSAITRRDLVGELFAAHELTHALQDQHWGMPVDSEPVTDSHGDRVLGRRALLEGDATLAGFAYVAGGRLDRDTIANVVDKLQGLSADLAARYPDVPAAIRDTVAFQYDEGTAFAARALTTGGWPAVDRLEADPPLSTAEVLHPARYFGDRVRPTEIALAGTESLERSGWTRTLEDTLGELDVRILARHTLPPPAAAHVAQGWQGDRLRALAHGDDLVLVWMTVWESPDEAAEFAGAAPSFLADGHVERRDARVLVLLPPPARVDADALAGRVWSATR